MNKDGLDIDTYGTKYWYLNDKLHRSDGPAVEFKSGNKRWYINGKRHRTDGPAVEYADGDGEWYIDGVKLSEKEYLQVTRNNKLELLGL